MPPGPGYNWYCVAHSVLDVLSQAARIRATQLEQQSSRVLTRGGVQTTKKRTRKNEECGPNLILLENTSTGVPNGLAPAAEQTTILPDGAQYVSPEQHPSPSSRISANDYPALSPIPRSVSQVCPEAAEPRPSPMEPVEQEAQVDPSAAVFQDKDFSAVRPFHSLVGSCTQGD